MFIAFNTGGGSKGLMVGPGDGATKIGRILKVYLHINILFSAFFVYTTKNNQLEGFRQLQHLPVNVVLSVLAW